MVYLFLAEGFEEVEALTAVDYLRRAKIEVCTVGVGGNEICGAHGIKVSTDITDNTSLLLLAKGDMEAVVLPGGMPGTLNLENSPIVNAFIKKAVELDIYVCAICAAPSILGKMGLLQGKNAVCYPGFEEYLEGAQIQDADAVTDGKFITGRSAGGAGEFALQIIKALKGEQAAKDIRLAVIMQ